MRSNKKYSSVLIVAVLFLFVFIYNVTLKAYFDAEVQRSSQILVDERDPHRVSVVEDDSSAGLNFRPVRHVILSRSEEEFNRHNVLIPNYLYPVGSGSLLDDFSRCRMSNCFDFSRCKANDLLRVHIVPSRPSSHDVLNETQGENNQIHRSILEVIRRSKHFEPNPERACIFVLEDDTLDRDPLSPSFRSGVGSYLKRDGRYGMNYLIFNLYSGTWPDYSENDFGGLQFGAAIIAKASNSLSYHRPDFDISLPLFSHAHPFSSSQSYGQDLRSNDRIHIHKNRTYLLTFKGKRYVYGSGSNTRNSLYHLDNGKDVIMLTTCRHGKRWQDSSDSRCTGEEIRYTQYDFVKLMKESKFCLTPRGRRLGSFRYLESLSHGCIPVVLSDSWVKPFDELIYWPDATVQIQEDLLLQTTDFLRDVSTGVMNEMEQNCINIYEKYFATIETITLTTLSIIEKRIKNQVGNIA